MLKRQTGFTLIELVMTIAMLSILALAAIPRLANTGEARVEGAMRKLISDMSYARRLAMSRCTSSGNPCSYYEIAFDDDRDSYSIFDSSGNYARDPLAGGTSLMRDLTFNSTPMFSGVMIDSPEFGDTSGASVRFDYAGIPYDNAGSPLGSVGRVWLNYPGTSRSVGVYPETGLIDIY